MNDHKCRMAYIARMYRKVPAFITAIVLLLPVATAAQRRTVATQKLPHGYRLVEIEQDNPPEHWEAIAHFKEFYFRSRKLSEQVGAYFISPSGKYALFEDPGVLLLFNARTGKIENVTDGTFSVPSNAEWSEGERTVAVTYFEGHKPSIINLR